MSCSKLVQVVREHCTATSETDAFCIFLKTHLCICQDAQNHPSHAMVELNRQFVQKILAVYEDHLNSKPQQEESWNKALAFYKRRHSEPLQTLARMVFAHVIDDLPPVLANVEVSKADYDLFLDNILHCAEKCHCFEPYGESVIEKMVIYARSYLDPRGHIPRFAISTLRELAWRKSLSLKDAKLHQAVR